MQKGETNMTILAVGFIDELAREVFTLHHGFVQNIGCTPPVNLVFLPPCSDVKQIAGWECTISFPDESGRSIILSYDRHLDITQSTIFLNEPDYPDSIA
jgi:hypothetical protein